MSFRFARPQLILLHAPSVYDFRKYPLMFGPIADGVPSTPLFEMYPIGFFSILEHLERHGIGVRIINLAVRMLSDEAFDVEAMLARLRPTAFGIDLHWLPHAQGSIEVAKLCKKYHPELPVIFGGYSATYFHQELIRYPEVDFIIRGDSAEEPLLQLMHALESHASSPAFQTIPNLVWKAPDGAVQVNPLTHVPGDLNHSANNYLRAFKSALRYRDVRSMSPWKGWTAHEWLDYPITPVITCRGCIHNCTFCGGSRNALALYCNRKKPAFRDPLMIAADIVRIAHFSRAPIFIIGDLLQPGKDYAATVLEELKRAKLKNHLVFELFTTAPQAFFDQVAGSVEHFNFEISPDTHDEQIRTAEGKQYTNAAIEANLTWALDAGCHKFDLFFMIGLPYQTRDSVMATVEWCGELMRTFGPRVVPFILPYAPFIDPGSIAYEQSEQYGYTILLNTLEEYRKALLAPSWKYALNYETNWLTRDDIVECAYQAGLRLNELKHECGLVDEAIYQRTEARITRAMELTAAVDELMTLENPTLRQERLLTLKPEFETLYQSVTHEKVQLDWPAGKRNLRLLPLLWAALLDSLRSLR